MAFNKIIAELDIKTSDLCKLCFHPVEDKEDYFCCNICNIQRKKNNGYANLMSHLEDKHTNEIKGFVTKERASKKGPLNSYLRPLSKDAKNLYAWIEWIVMGDHAQMFVENKYTRKYARLESISRHTLQNYMEDVKSCSIIFILTR